MREHDEQGVPQLPTDVTADESDRRWSERFVAVTATRKAYPTLGAVAVAVLVLSVGLIAMPSCLGQIQQPQQPAASVQDQTQQIALGSEVVSGPGVASSNASVAAAPVAEPASVDTGAVALVAGMEHGYVLAGTQGDAYLVVDLAASQAPQNAVRPAMSVALVIDRSGSMSGQKMSNAIMAASSFIQSMADGDVVAIYSYDDVVEQLAPPMVVNPATRPALVAAVTRIYARGSTNLHGGLQAGIAAMLRAESERPLRRVVLISDGRANVGPSTPMELGLVAAQAAAMGVSVTSIGVGLDYDEALLGAVAARSGGRFYHLQEPYQMAMILEAELNALSQTVARNVIIDFVPAAGVQFISATGADVIRQGDQIQLRVGDLLGGTTRPVVVSLRVPTNVGDLRPAGDLSMSYSTWSGDTQRANATVNYGVTDSQQRFDQSARPQFALAVEQHQAALTTLRAAEVLNSGDSDGAASILEQQAQAMEQRAQALPAAERQRLSADAQRLRQSSVRARRARSRPARRASSLSLHDDALDGLGL